MPAVKKQPSSVGQAIAAGRARIAELVNNATVVNGKTTTGVVFVADFKKLTNPWVAFIERLQDLKLGEAMVIDTDKPPAGLIKAANTLEVELEYGRSKDGKLLVRAHSGAIDAEVG